MKVLDKENLLGAYLKDRRTKLDPAAFGFPLTRRRTAGLRREEVAQLANLSTTWYTWLEQGRGGAPSAEVLDRLANALMLTEVEREHLFILALGHPPAVRQRDDEGVTAHVQHVLDSLELSPAVVRNSIWDVVAWNHAAAVVIGPYGKTPDERNILRRIFGNAPCGPDEHWESFARFVVGAFRAESMRNGRDVKDFVKELSRQSPQFESLWRENDVSTFGEGTKHFPHPVAGLIELEYSAFGILGRPDLSMVVYTAATEADKDKDQEIGRTQCGTTTSNFILRKLI